MLGLLVMLALSGTTGAAQTAVGETTAMAPSWSFGGEVRMQYERFAYEEWGAEPDDRSGYVLQRVMVRAGRTLGSRAAALVEMKSGLEAGRVGGPRLPDEDRLDLHQGYLDLRAGPAIARLGRQELQFGSARLVSMRDLNVRQSFDAARVTLLGRAWRVDAFAGHPATTRAGALDDATDPERALWGVYGVRQPGGAAVDLYYLGYRRRSARFDSVAGPERRHTFGIRLWGLPSALNYNLEVAGQWGAVGDSRIRAWTVASDTGYQFSFALRPRVGLRADVTSGDRDRHDRTLGTFNAMFPRGAYFGYIASAGPANHIDLNPHLDLHTGSVVITAGWLVFWRHERADGIYTMGGQLLRSGAGTRSLLVGHSPGVGATWRINPRVTVLAHASVFTAGPFVRETGDTDDSTLFRASITYRFQDQ
ncbi:MAG: alginate export family protein [Vicinamibacterales bacterium]